MPETTLVVQLDEERLKRFFKQAAEEWKANLVLTWHPLVGPAEVVPLNEHWSFPADVVGEFRLSTREVPTSAGDAPEVSGA